MARYKKEIVREVTVISCDLCDYVVEDDWSVCTRFDVMECDGCKKDVCLVCVGDYNDGILCTECADKRGLYNVQ